MVSYDKSRDSDSGSVGKQLPFLLIRAYSCLWCFWWLPLTNLKTVTTNSHETTQPIQAEPNTFDLPIALGILGANGDLGNFEQLDNTLSVGELLLPVVFI